MEAYISQKPPLPTTSSISASTPSPSPSNIKIERVLNSSSASIEPFLQPSVARRPSLVSPPSSLPTLTTLPLSESPAGTSKQLQQYHQHQPQPLLSSTSPERSMAAAAVATQPAHVMQPFTRPIRFVANDGQPHAKRRRISAACKTCRKRKTRCSGEKPVCETCRQNGHSCLGYSVPSSSVPSQQRQQSNHQVSASPTPTPTVTTPTEKSTLKEPLIAPTPIRASPQDQRRGPLESASLSQQPELPSHQHDQRGTSTPSRTSSQKRKSTDYHQGEDSKAKQWDADHGKAESRGGGGLEAEGPSSVLRYQAPSATQRLAHRMPYFRYFGPTAIVPGYKQMVVEIKDRSNLPRHASHSISASSSSTSPTSTFAGLGRNTTPASTITSGSTMEEIPFYDQGDTAPNHKLITHLVETFFIHLGCNFPFLRQEAFTRDVEEKRVDAILVDAVCAVAARFSNHSFAQTIPQGAEAKSHQNSRRCEYGTAFANRAKSSVVDTFACPNLATVQACILLAYVEFGSNRDSGLWMFLGIAIRMAQDLGLHKLEGARGDAKSRKEVIRARSRSTGGKNEKDGGSGRHSGTENETQDEEMKDEEAEVRERERTDTFWAVFFLDRVISSGTGRPVTIRDKEVEIDFPSEEASLTYPPPFPALIRIVQLYGRITDLLNSINDVHMVTAETLSRLLGMEAELTRIYQRLSPNIHFNVQNFRYYSSINQSAVFLLLHFWFHTLIVLLHRPTLLIAFEGRVQELFPKSRELSMSSAKTISDILTFAELIDPRAVSGNPFTSQPIYIAACAFLQESATHSFSNPTSRSSSPPNSGELSTFDAMMLASLESASARDMRPPTASLGSPAGSSDTIVAGCGDDLPSESKQKSGVEDCSHSQKMSQKHALLAQSAYENYQGCYKALKGLETYWEGVKYILTVLDQKAKGIVDPLLYTVEEMESVEVHRWGANMWNRFRGNIQGDISEGGLVSVKVEGSLQTGLVAPSNMAIPERVPSPLMSALHNDTHQAIGLSATGTTNSPNLNLTWLFPNPEHGHNPQNQFVTVASPHGTLSPQDPRGGMQPSMHPPLPHSSFIQHGTSTPTTSPASKYSIDGSTPAAADAEMLLGLSAAGQKVAFGQEPHEHQAHGMDGLAMGNVYSDGTYPGGGAAPGTFGYGIMLESEDVDMNNLNWSLPCLEYMPPYWDGAFTTTEEVG